MTPEQSRQGNPFRRAAEGDYLCAIANKPPEVTPPAHVDSADCWCRPIRTYIDPVTDAEVWVHKGVS